MYPLNISEVLGFRNIMTHERLDVDGIVASMVPDLIEDIQPVEASSGYGHKCG